MTENKFTFQLRAVIWLGGVKFEYKWVNTRTAPYTSRRPAGIQACQSTVWSWCEYHVCGEKFDQLKCLSEAMAMICVSKLPHRLIQLSSRRSEATPALDVRWLVLVRRSSVNSHYAIKFNSESQLSSTKSLPDWHNSIDFSLSSLPLDVVDRTSEIYIQVHLLIGFASENRGHSYSWTLSSPRVRTTTVRMSKESRCGGKSEPKSLKAIKV